MGTDYSVLYESLHSPRGTFNSLYATRLRSPKKHKSNPLTEGDSFSAIHPRHGFLELPPV